MKSRHRSEFGAELLAGGGVRFRLWAPAAERVEVCLDAATYEECLVMERRDAGWYEIVAPHARAGTRYRFRINGAAMVPDPASRFNPDDVHAASEVIDPEAFAWHDDNWLGRPWAEAVIYELHIGTFTPAGTFLGVIERLDYLRELGITAIELMPIADFPGARNWGYDGVLPFAPDSRYGHPDDLKRLIAAAHDKGLMVFLDVVYNHFGPEGNYLHSYAPDFFTDRHSTPWGAAINFDGANSQIVRAFFIHNALYWLEEFHFDGLRFDAVHAIMDDSRPDLLEEIAAAVYAGPGQQRLIHLMLENDRNAAHYLQTGSGGRGGYIAQWNDDWHHAMHVVSTGETAGYYADYSDRALWHLGRCLSEGFAYQGEASAYRGNAARGEASGHLSPTAFICFQQNHDQVGNRALGERLAALVTPRVLFATTAVLLLAPSPPLLFMGEEFGARDPFLFFCDFGPELAAAVTAGRRREFAEFAAFRAPATRANIPDPNAEATFLRSRLDWRVLPEASAQACLSFYRELLALRAKEIVPRLRHRAAQRARFHLRGRSGLEVNWILGDGARLILLCNLGDEPLSGVDTPRGEPLYLPDPQLRATLARGVLPPWTTTWWLDRHAAPE